MASDGYTEYLVRYCPKLLRQVERASLKGLRHWVEVYGRCSVCGAPALDFQATSSIDPLLCDRCWQETFRWLAMKKAARHR